LSKKRLGNFGEYLACKHYQKLKHQILATNFQTPFGEIDLITKHQNQIYIIEVKATTTQGFGSAYQRWYSLQRLRLLKSIHYLIARNILHKPENIQIQFLAFDLSSPSKVRLTRYENVPLSI
jgi:putative endonuclease